MKQKLLMLNHAILFLCASMYLGTGGSLIFFNLPIAPQLTPDNYYLQFVPQIEAATNFFRPMTMVMLVLCVVMTISEWKQKTRWVPILTAVWIIAATVLTVYWIFPVNAILEHHVTDPVLLKSTLDEWIFLNKVRVFFWILEWVTLMWYFADWAFKGRYAK